MPRRNLYLLLLISLVSFACYKRLPESRYSQVLAAAADHVARDYFRPVDDLKLFEGSMKGMMQPLDENSAYIAAVKKQAFEEDISKEFGGIGVHVVTDPKTKRITVVLPVPQGPAVKAGVRAGDTIVRVDGKSLAGMTLHEASALLRGKPDTPVALSVLHAGESKEVELKMVRKVIHEDTVQGYVMRADGSWDFMLPDQKGIGYIHITGFAETEGALDASRNTLDDLKEALTSIDAAHLRGLVLDLRDNPGGSQIQH
jgi:carboxyl-terminal processing protease